MKVRNRILCIMLTVLVINSIFIRSKCFAADVVQEEEASVKVTPIEPKKSFITAEKVCIWKDPNCQKSTGLVAYNGAKIYVIGETVNSDGERLYQIAFIFDDEYVIGFVCSDFVSIDENSENALKNLVLMNVEEEPYIMPGFNPITIQYEDQCINAYRNGDFFITYAQDQNGKEGWIVLDTGKGTYQRYLYATEGVSIDENLENALKNLVLMNVEEEPYIMPGFNPIIIQCEDQRINAYRNGDFIITYAQDRNGEEGWIVLDTGKDTYQRYLYATKGVSIPSLTKLFFMLMAGVVITSCLIGIVCVMILIVVLIIRKLGIIKFKL